MAGEVADFSVKADVGKTEAERILEFGGDAVPAVEAALDFTDVVVAQAGVEGGKSGNLPRDNLARGDFVDGIFRRRQAVIVGQFGFLVRGLSGPSCNTSRRSMRFRSRTGRV